MQKTELYNYSYLAKDLQTGDKVATLGSQFGGQPTTGIIIDDGAPVQKIMTTLKERKMTAPALLDSWLKQVDDKIDVRLFRAVYFFTQIMNRYFPDLTQNQADRKQTFIDGDKTLSTLIEQKQCACAEYSVLAQLYLQKQGFDTTLFEGGLLTQKNQEAEEHHTFLLLKDKDRSYVFDPVNPLTVGNMLCPRVAEIKLTPNELAGYFKDVVPNGKCGFLPTVNLFDHSQWYYGCGDGEVIPSDLYQSKILMPIKEKVK